MSADDEPPEDWAEPADYPDEAYVEHERFIASREPFTFHDERDRAMAASFYGDHQDIRFYAGCVRRDREDDEAFWAGSSGKASLTRADLEALRWLDALSDCNEDDYNEDQEDDDRSLSLDELRRLWAIGRRLHERDYTFWRRLRKLGATPGLLKEANAILNPCRVAVHRPAGGLSRFLLAPRRPTRARSRGRRSTPARRRVKATSRGPDDGPLGGGEPPHRGRLAAIGGAA